MENRYRYNTKRFLEGLKKKDAANPLKDIQPGVFLIPMYFHEGFSKASDIDFNAFTMADIDAAYDAAYHLWPYDDDGTEYEDISPLELLKANRYNPFFEYTSLCYTIKSFYQSKTKRYIADDDFI